MFAIAIVIAALAADAPTEDLRALYGLDATPPAIPVDAAGACEERDVVYGTAGGRELMVTLFLPTTEATAPRPAIVFMHGGGWRTWKRGQFFPHARAAAAQGFVGLCVDYRSSQMAQFPAALEDVKCAVRYLRAHAEEYMIDPERIAAVGGSAGAHLAAMTATTPDYDEWNTSGGWPGYSSAVQAAVLFNGEFDLPLWWEIEKARPAMKAFLGAPLEEAEELYRAASPFYQVKEGAPPCLLLHGEEDITSRPRQSANFCKALRDAGALCELVLVPGVGHAWFNREPHLSLGIERMLLFLEAQLRADVAR